MASLQVERQASQNLALAFMMVDRQISVGKQQNLLSSGTDVLAGYVNLDKFLSNHDQLDRFNNPALNKDVLSNNEQFNTVVHVMELVKMNEGISQTFNVDQMMQNVLPVISTVVISSLNNRGSCR